MSTDAAPDVLVLGEVLVEVSTAQEPGDGVPARPGFSGDALNVAAASAAAGAAARFAALAPLAAVVKPSHPGETTTLLGTAPDATDAQVLAAVHALGAKGVVLTRGARGALVSEAGAGPAVDVPVIPADRVVDQTGAGDCMTGTMCARLALGDDLVTAVWQGSAAASLSVGGQGGTGHVPSLHTTRTHLAAYRAALGKQD